MNSTDANNTDANNTDERFDALVDGSLPAAEYRALLASLDDEPGGWRKCALAFLEAQALQLELGSLVSAPTSTAQPNLPVKSQRTWKSLSLALAMAASFAGALAVGVLAPQFFRERGQEPPLAGNLNMRTPGVSAFAKTDGGQHQVLRPVGNVNLVVEGSDAAGQVPVYEVGAELEEFLARDEEALGPDLIDLFRQQGWEVRHEQQYVPAPLEDGRQVIVPVQGYEIRPVSRTY